MATDKGCFTAPPVSSLRKIMKPVISTDVMGNRNVEIRPVGARAEPAFCYADAMHSDAVKAAEQEEEKIRAVQVEKAARLKQFQQDVRKRVRQMNKAKRKQQLEGDCQAMENHLRMVRSSLRASDCLTERKDCAVIPPPSHYSYSSQHASLYLPYSRHQQQQQQPSPSSSSSSALIGDTEEAPQRKGKVFEKHNQQVHAFTKEARKKLSFKRLEDLADEVDNFPGWKWFNSPEAKQRQKKTHGEEDKEDDDDDEKEKNSNTSDDDDDDDDVKDGLCDKDRNVSNHVEIIRHVHTETRITQTRLGDVEKEKDDRSDDDDSDDREEEKEVDKEDEKEEAARRQRVKFNLRTVEVERPQSAASKRGKKKGSSDNRPKTAPDLRKGATEIAEKKRQEQQKLTYRRLYSQLERQAVRDNQRRTKQKSQIQKIKREKEKQRRQEEDRARRLVEARDPMTGETSVESELRQQLERSHLEETLQERGEQMQKQREMMRYLDALRSSLREKLRKNGQELPSLCCCGETLFDTHPDTCANNCFYYKNHRAYARSLQSLLTSSEIM